MPDSPTADQIAENTHRQAIMDLAIRLNPEDGYETDQANMAASVFSMLVTTARLYADLSATNGEAADDTDLWGTLQGLAENLSTPTATFGVEQGKPDETIANLRRITPEELDEALRPVGTL